MDSALAEPLQLGSSLARAAIPRGPTRAEPSVQSATAARDGAHSAEGLAQISG